MGKGRRKPVRHPIPTTSPAPAYALRFPVAPATRIDYWMSAGPTAESRLLQTVISFHRRIHDGKAIESSLLLSYELKKALELLGCDAQVVEAVGRISIPSGNDEKLVALLGT